MRSKRLLAVITALIFILGMQSSAAACTAIYAGNGITENGNLIYGRIEDFSIDYPKIF